MLRQEAFSRVCALIEEKEQARRLAMPDEYTDYYNGWLKVLQYTKNQIACSGDATILPAWRDEALMGNERIIHACPAPHGSIRMMMFNDGIAYGAKVCQRIVEAIDEAPTW